MPNFTTQSTVLSAFYRQAAKTPDQPAVVDGEAALTYADLRRRIAASAAVLQRRGVRRGDVVPVLAGRTCGAVAAMLGVLQAGAAAMPVDTSLPGDAQRRQLELSGSPIVLTAGANVSVSGLAVIEADAVPDLDGALPDAPAVSPEDLAYVIPTSGTTGSPKGAKNSHGALAHLVEAIQETILLNYGTGLRIALLAPWAFDPWVQQVFPALVRGDTLFIADDLTRLDPRLLARFYRDHRIDVSDGTPTHLSLLATVGHAPLANLTVRHFIIGGQRMQSAAVGMFYERLHGLNPKITNIYGVAECAVDSLSFTFDRTTLPTGPDIPVGRPVGRTTFTIRDNRGAEVPQGQSGELWLGGPGVGAGYLGDPELTASKFVTRHGQRLYRTGDEARQLPDGNVEILGRLDHQVKIADKRVELGQVESALREYRPIRIGDEASFDSTVVTRLCNRCVLSSAQPGVVIDANGICNVCRNHERWKSSLDRYWKLPRDLAVLADRIRTVNRGQYDCLLLFSGGKDSTFVLHRLHEAGLRVYAWVFDNGFISDQAFANIKRTTTALGVAHTIARAPRMNEIFVSSLKTSQTVCDGCFRALTTLSTHFAVAHDIPLVVTGLSRGQIVDTKLARLLEDGITDPTEIEEDLIRLRKLYHQRKDALYGLLGEPPAENAIDRIKFVDYFRYEDVSEAQVVDCLKARDPYWSHPANTGSCSTNCGINDPGIVVHQAVHGFHNYAAPLSWDVRLGRTSRAAALRKVSAPVDGQTVAAVLREIGYEPQITDAAVVKAGNVLVAFFSAEQKVNMRDLRNHLERQLPRYAVPARLHQVDALPLSHNGKIDVKALADLDVRLSQDRAVAKVESPIEGALLELWGKVLGFPPADVTDNFFDAGGESLEATLLVGLIEERFELSDLPLALVYANPTIKGLAQEIAKRLEECASLPDGVVLMKRGAEL